MLAEHVVREGGSTAEARARYAYRRATSHTPSEAAVQRLVALYDAEYTRFSQDRAAARALLATGEHPIDRTLDPADLAAWTVVSNTIMNLDAVVYTR